ncbi:MAG: M48 family metallopeptidase [Burkholderiales bacterium]|jgi:Zn-dependent protease with chaperone function|nr:M48 family metallopeptidase [Burkholderiales bacterium]
MSLQAYYFDGRHSHRQPVRLSVSHACLLIEAENNEQRAIPVADIRVSEQQGRAPRTLRFDGDNAFCEVAQSPELDALLTELGCRASVIVRLQNRWRWVLASLAGIALIFTAGYLWGLPWGAEVLAPHVPIAAMRPVSSAALEQLDKSLFKPSALPEQRREKLLEGFRQFAAVDPDLAPYDDDLSLNFRAAPRIGPNAFAFPDGKIVLLDELAILHDDDEILAVLAHELGHLSKRHGIRQLIQTSAIAAVTAVWLGDVSVATTALYTTLLNSGYSRDMEREADDYAAEMLRHQNKSPDLLASALEKMEEAHRKKTSTSEQDSKDHFLDWISSHPNTSERIQRLREN